MSLVVGCKRLLLPRQIDYDLNTSAGIGIQQRRSSKFVWIALIWLSIGMFDASDTVFSMRAEGHHHAWLSLFVTLLLSWLPWALASPLILQLARWHQPDSKSAFAWLLHIAACAATGLVYAAWTAGAHDRSPSSISKTGLPLALLCRRFQMFREGFDRFGEISKFEANVSDPAARLWFDLNQAAAVAQTPRHFRDYTHAEPGAD
jgi:hypothetical protein